VLILNQFYVSIVFLGIILILVSLVWIAIDRKSSSDYLKQLDRKKQEVIDIISDVEQILDELNKFSDYVLTQLNSKSDELNQKLRLADEKLKQFENKMSESSNVQLFSQEAGAQEIKEEVIKYEPDIVNESNAENKNRVSLLDKRYKEILDLIDKGLTHAEIAKALSIGKGEVELILEINK